MCNNISRFLISFIWIIAFSITDAQEISKPTRTKQIISDMEVSSRSINPNDFDTHSEDTISLRNGKYDLIIYYNQSQKSAAEYSREMLEKFLPKAEDFLNMGLSPPNGKFVLFAEGAVCGGYEKIESDLNDGHVALFFHEFGHLWYPGKTRIPGWLHQGIVSYYPVAMQDSGNFQFTKKERRHIENAWVFRSKFPKERDIPLVQTETSSGKYEDLYNKTYKLQYLIHHELGNEGYRTFLQNLFRDGKNKMMDVKDVTELLNEIKPMKWSALFSGWVTKGPYRTHTPDDFFDHDLDGLMSIEEKFLGTAPLKRDSDGDFVADGYEVLYGTDPVDSTSRPDQSNPIIDGIKEPVRDKWNLMAENLYNENDGKHGTNVKLLQVYKTGKKLYLRSDYFKKPENKTLIHTIHLRDSKSGRNYWIQSYDTRHALWISEFDDGIPFKEWEKSKISTSSVQMGFGDIFELELDIESFHLDDRATIMYIAGGYASPTKTIWNADDSGVISFYLNPSDIQIDGDSSDIFKYVNNGKVIPDPFGDSKADFKEHDLKSFSYGLKDNMVYLTASYYGDKVRTDWHPTTFHVSYPDEKQNLWIQFFGKSTPGIKSFRDGTPFAKWTPLTVDKNLMLFAFCERRKSLECQIPVEIFKSLLPEVKEAKRFQIKLITGGLKDKKSNWSVDESEWLEVVK